MSTANLNPAPSAKPAVTGLGHKTVHGFAWMTAQALGSKVVGMLSQIVLAWLFNKKDFGAVGLAYTTAAFVGLLQQLGVRDVLVQRHIQFRRWATPALWMSLTAALLTSLLLLLVAPLAAHVFRAPELVGLLAVIALGGPFNAWGNIASAKLQIEMRFKPVAAIGMVMAVLTAALSIAMAALGCGPYSFVVPLTATGIITSIMFWWIVRPPIRRRLELRRWKFLLRDSSLMLGISALSTLVANGDYLALGLFHNQEVVGVYFFAFNLSMQTIQFFGGNVAGTFFPALSHLQNDPARQTQVFIRAARALALVATPLCLLQAALAEPLLRLVFHTRWLEAVRPFQILSLGTAFILVASPASSLIKAQGRFLFFFWWSFALAAVFLGMVILGALLGKATSVATAVAIYYAIFGPLGTFFGIHQRGGHWQDLLSIYLPAWFLSCLAILPPLAVTCWAPVFRQANLLSVVFVPLVAIIIYIPLARRVAPEPCAEIWSRAKPIWSALTGQLRHTIHN